MDGNSGGGESEDVRAVAVEGAEPGVVRQVVGEHLSRSRLRR